MGGLRTMAKQRVHCRAPKTRYGGGYAARTRIVCLPTKSVQGMLMLDEVLIDSPLKKYMAKAMGESDDGDEISDDGDEISGHWHVMLSA